jgi:rSAM/selenodomain-associated transferase 2
VVDRRSDAAAGRGGPCLPSLSIIVPVLNESRHAEALKARLATLAKHDVLVVDGGSRDDTLKRLGDGDSAASAGRDAKVSYRLLRGPRGRAAQMNRGARQSHSDALLFLHADTGFSPAHARAAQRAISSGVDFGCFTLRIASRDPRLTLAGRIISLRSRLIPSATGDQAIFMRRALFERLDGYRELPLCEDLDLIGRARHHGRFACIDPPVTTSARRWEQRGVNHTILLMWLLRLGFHAGCAPATLKRLYEDVR